MERFYKTIRRRSRDACRAARGWYPLGVVSNKVHDRTLEVIDTYFPNTFDAVFGNRPGVPLKPDPAGVFDALAALDCDPSYAFYLGDTGVDIETGKRAGIYSAGALWGFRTADELTARARISSARRRRMRSPPHARFMLP